MSGTKRTVELDAGLLAKIDAIAKVNEQSTEDLVESVIADHVRRLEAAMGVNL